jgi:hypothetical protein
LHAWECLHCVERHAPPEREDPTVRTTLVFGEQVIQVDQARVAHAAEQSLWLSAPRLLINFHVRMLRQGICA